MLPFYIIYRGSRKPNAPTIRKFRRKRQSTTAPRTIAYDNNIWQSFHHRYKIIPRTKCTSIGQYNDRLLITNPARRRIFYWIKLREVLMPESRFMGNITDDRLSVNKPRHQSLDIRQRPAAIAAHIDNQSRRSR